MAITMSRFVRNLSAAAEEFPEETETAVRETAREARRLARENTSGKVLQVRTGELRDSIKAEVQAHSGGVTFRLRAGNERVPYARIHEYGGVIHATNAEYLTFRIADQWISVPSVTIPARPYLRPAVEEAAAGLPRLLEAAIVRALGV